MSFRRRVFPGNQLHWYGQPRTRKQNNTYIPNTKQKQKKTAPANTTNYALAWYAFTTNDHEKEQALFLLPLDPMLGFSDNEVMISEQSCFTHSNEIYSS